jgi:hypothetical protein
MTIRLGNQKCFVKRLIPGKALRDRPDPHGAVSVLVMDLMVLCWRVTTAAAVKPGAGNSFGSEGIWLNQHLFLDIYYAG